MTPAPILLGWFATFGGSNMQVIEHVLYYGPSGRVCVSPATSILLLCPTADNSAIFVLSEIGVFSIANRRVFFFLLRGPSPLFCPRL